MKNVDIVNRIFDIMGMHGKINYVSDRPGHDVRYSINSSKVKNLGWKPLVNGNVLSGQQWKLK